MAKRKRKKNNQRFFDDISPHTKQAIGAVIFAVFGIFFIFSSLDYAGVAGAFTHEALTLLFGYGFVLAPIVCALYVYVLMRPKENEEVSVPKVIGVALLFLAFLGLFELYRESGGVVGLSLATPLTWLFGTAVSGILLGALLLIGVFLTFNTGFVVFNPFTRREREEDEEESLEDMEVTLPDEEPDEEEEADAEEEPEAEDEEAEEESEKTSFGSRFGFGKGAGYAVSSFHGPYDPPPLSLLQKDGSKARGGDIKASSNIIKRTLKNFNIDVEMDEVKIGPSVTRYALKPAEGVRISKIVGLQNNLELALAASPIRIEAPIPGKSLVGIEVPNSQKQRIGLSTMLSSPEFTDSPKPLLVALGRDITGGAHFVNIGKMPHGLIAGTTGSGKSATIHAMITSLLYRNSPEQLRLIMVDPKRVELTLYNGIPHLLAPVITDPKKTIMSLKWAIKEMERRYDVLQAEKVRDITSYHEKVYAPAKAAFEKKGSPEDDAEDLPEPLPYIVIIIDELADLMSAYPRELEACIVRLAQMSRAVGIHLMLSTQRPSVNVITGLIKANIPGRIALQVNSQVDSRTILDQVGAEKLLGSGDMLFLSSETSKPLRLQSAFVSEEEVKKVVDYLKDQTDAAELDAIDFEGESGKGSDAVFGAALDEDEEDELYEEAKATVIESGKASTSFLQRKFRIGYSRAARLIDMLEERGVIGPGEGAKPREILVGKDSRDEDED